MCIKPTIWLLAHSRCSKMLAIMWAIWKALIPLVFGLFQGGGFWVIGRKPWYGSSRLRDYAQLTAEGSYFFLRNVAPFTLGALLAEMGIQVSMNWITSDHGKDFGGKKNVSSCWKDRIWGGLSRNIKGILLSILLCGMEYILLPALPTTSTGSP